MNMEPKFLDVTESGGYFGVRKVYIPKKYNNTVLRRQYDIVLEINVQKLVDEVNKIDDQSERKITLMGRLEEMLG